MIKNNKKQRNKTSKLEKRPQRIYKDKQCICCKIVYDCDDINPHSKLCLYCTLKEGGDIDGIL